MIDEKTLAEWEADEGHGPDLSARVKRLIAELRKARGLNRRDPARLQSLADAAAAEEPAYVAASRPHHGPNEKRRQMDTRRGLALLELEPADRTAAMNLWLELRDCMAAAQSTDDPDFVPVVDELQRKMFAFAAKWKI